jgi:hypothetical protein
MALSQIDRENIIEEHKLRQRLQGKNIVVSIILSILIPGLGDLYCGAWFKALIFFSANILCFMLSFLLGIGAMLYTVVWFFGLISAWLSVRKYQDNVLRDVENDIKLQKY